VTTTVKLIPLTLLACGAVKYHFPPRASRLTL
jgi:hypothetical protein